MQHSLSQDKSPLVQTSGRPRVVLLNPPAPRPVLRDNYCGFMSKASYLWPPIDLLVQSGWLAESCQVTVTDAVAERLSEQRCLDELGQQRPDLVLMLTSGATFEDDAALAARLRGRLPGVKLVVGLNELVIPARDYLQRFEQMDAVLVDYSSPDLRDALLGRPTAGQLVTREQLAGPPPRRPRPRPLSYPIPRHDLFPLQRYNLPLGWSGSFSTVLTGFGCAHDCSFCTGSAIPHRRRKKEQVLEELEQLRSLGIQNLFFVDYTFTSNRRYLLDLCQQMVARGFSFRWTCFGRVDHLDRELLAAMQQAGCDLLQIGVESGDDQILQRYHKGFTVAQTRQAFALCKEQGLRTLAFFIIGLPGETHQTVQSTIDLAIALDPDLASFSMPTPDPGTALLDEAVQRGIVDGSATQVVSTVGPMVFSEQLDEQQIRALKAEAVRRFYLRPSFLWRQVRSLRSLSDLRERAQNAAELLLRSR